MDNIKPFKETLEDNDLTLLKEEISILQINTGLLCNQVCKHCHLSAGPDKTELMNRKTIDEIADFASRNSFEVIDITGGAPEMNPELPYIIEKLKDLAPEIILRSNLTALYEMDDNTDLINLFKNSGITITASFPSVNEKQFDGQRGSRFFNKSVSMLKKLNSIGYGMADTNLILNLVSNPSGAFMPVPQEQAEKRFKSLLLSRWNISFSNLYTFANVPLGRYEKWLKKSGNYDSYINQLASKFNPEAVHGVMCKNLMSVSWDGTIFDCDFNLEDN